MNVMNDIAEARASALSLRASAKACTPEQGALRFRLTRAAESLDAMVLLAMRGIECVEQFEQEARELTAASNAFTIAEGAALSAKDCELILRALDALDRDMQTELANKGQDAAAGHTRSRILIVRSKLQAKQQEGAQLAPLEHLLRRAVDHAFESGGEVDNGELLAWFTEWREEAQTALHELAARKQGGAS